MISALCSDNERLLSDYGAAFVTAWKITHNYRVWFSNKHPAVAAVTPGCVHVPAAESESPRFYEALFILFGWGRLSCVCCAADTRSRASTV